MYKTKVIIYTFVRNNNEFCLYRIGTDTAIDGLQTTRVNNPDGRTSHIGNTGIEVGSHPEPVKITSISSTDIS